MRFVSTVFVATLLSAAPMAHAATQVFSDAAALQGALSAYSVETFSAQVGKGRESARNPHAASETFDYGDFTITKTYNRNGYGSLPGAWRGKPTAFSGDVITFDSPIYGWGAQILTADGGNGVGIRVFNGTELVGSVGTGSKANNAYFGFVSDTGFTRIELLSGFRKNGRGGADGYRLDNMTYGTVSVVPLPAGSWLLLTGLAGLAAAGRLRRAARS